MTDTIHVVAAAVIAAAAVALLMIMFRRNTSAAPALAEATARLRQLEGDLATIRDARSISEKDLAVEREKSSRIPGLEQALVHEGARAETERETRSIIERQLAAATEAQSRIEAALIEAKAQIQAIGAAGDAALAQLAASRHERGRLDSSLAEKAVLLTEKAERAGILQKQMQELSAALEVVRVERGELERRLSTLQETLDQERRQAGEKLQLLVEAREGMTKEFRILANEVMAQHGESFGKQNKEQIDAILVPMREKLTEFQSGLQTAQNDSAKERATLGEQIRHLSEASARMTTETVNLTRALKGKAQTQGAWGEMILSSILQRCGLREGEEYVTQASQSTDEGRHLRPDVIVNLPGGQHVVIDAKVSLSAFEAHVNAETEEAKAAHLERHLDSMRTHIRTLSSKEYQALISGGLDYVIMFVPIEGALAAALRRDPELTSFAVQNNVAIATPTTLMIALRTVDSVWQVERRNRNAEAIAERAGKMYGKFVSFIDDLKGIGVRINQAQGSYQSAMGKLTAGPGNLVRQFEQLKELGAKTGKSLPSTMLGDDKEELREVAQVIIASSVTVAVAGHAPAEDPEIFGNGIVALSI